MFVWMENNELKVAFQREFAPEDAIEIDTLGLNPVPPLEVFIKIENGRIVLRNQDEILQKLKEAKLTELKNYVGRLLEPTDYVVARIAEEEINGDTDTAEQLKQKYAKQLQEREAIRRWNEQMKQAIKKAKTLEELRQIEIRYG